MVCVDFLQALRMFVMGEHYLLFLESIGKKLFCVLQPWQRTSADQTDSGAAGCTSDNTGERGHRASQISSWGF